MDLHNTTQMLTSRDIRILHIESADVCQASCPQCARETDPNFDKNAKHHLSVDVLAAILPKDFISSLDKMFMCGNYGDPAANHQTLAIYKWFRKQNSNIVLGMNTNGALQTTFWWHELAQIMDQPKDYTVFSIDGLEDTNDRYRIGVSWKKLMQNAEAFIAGGGSAHWDMLIYQHNEHQVKACEQLARDMGFKWFRAKVSKRAMTGSLQAPIHWHRSQVVSSSILCRALEEKSMYIDAQGRVSPCCWLGARQRDFVEDFDLVQQSWTSAAPDPICQNTCGTLHGDSNFTNQWQYEVAL